MGIDSAVAVWLEPEVRIAAGAVRGARKGSFSSSEGRNGIVWDLAVPVSCCCERDR
jgi:hypothetical protein